LSAGRLFADRWRRMLRLHALEETVLNWLALDWVMLAIAAWLLIGVAGVGALRSFALVARLLFPLGGLVALLLAGAWQLSRAP